MTSDITYQTIESNSYSNVFTLLNTRSNIADPRGSADRTFIYDADPLQKGMSFGLFPYIVLELPEIEYSNISMDGQYKFITWKHKIVVRTSRTGSSNANNPDLGRLDMFAITDDLQTMFNSASVKLTLRQWGMEKAYLKKIGTDVVVIDQKMLYEATYELTYKTRTVVRV